jgi:hypothetical protein
MAPKQQFKTPQLPVNTPGVPTAGKSPFPAAEDHDHGVTDTGEANTASNVGAGAGVFKQKTGVDLEFKSLTAGANITITPSANEIAIASTASGGCCEPLTNGDATTPELIFAGGDVIMA